MPKGLQTVGRWRWLLLGSAALLTVVAGVLGWLEITTHSNPAPRSWVQHTATVCWLGYFVLAGALPIARWAVKRVERAVERAGREQRLTTLADLLEDNVRSGTDKRR
ncbi:hypothetical protein ALI144C_45035 [Actinosynnema sp. ALI-1.44]|nr:hypothetical protein ALI144C_45035 [Actinosynnema sp. ALI-1.44]